MRLSDELQSAIDEARAIVRIGYPWWLRPFLMRNIVAITLGRRVYVAAGAASEPIERILRHELVHVCQVNRLGLTRFLYRYLAEFIRHWRATGSVSRAYGLISFEIEAYGAEEGPSDAYNRAQQP